MSSRFIDFIPPPAVYTAIISALTIIVFLFLFSHGLFKVIKPGRRFCFAVFGSLILWPVLLWLTDALIPFNDLRLMDLIAGVFVIVTAIFVSFTVWSLLVWGFTLTMLLNLAQQDSAIELEDWINRYGGGEGLETFFRDRMEVLFRYGMAVRNGDKILLTPGRGMLTGRVVRLLKCFFGIRKDR